jgi:glycosyltransferase involved in cell wall biosynthesis
LLGVDPDAIQEEALRIAFIDSKLNLKSGGGSNQSLHMVASKLVELGHQVMVITLFPALNAYPDDLPYQVISEGMISNRLDKKHRLAIQRVLHRYENQVDIYHLWEPWLILEAAVYRRMGGKTPIVAYLNNYSFCTNLGLMDTECYRHCGLARRVQHRPENPVRKALLLPFRALEYCLEVTMLNRVDAFIAISPAVAEIYSWRKIDPQKIFVVPPAIDYAYLQNQRHSRRSQSSPSGRYDVLYVGRLCPEKGVDILIDAISKVDSPLTLHIVGDGPHRNSLEQLTEQLDLSEQVTFHGWKPYDEVIDSYLNSQLFVHPGRWPEPLGRAVLDAMALEVPVIAADSGGPPWALQDSGLTFRPGDSEDLADKIKAVHEDTALAADLTRRAESRVKNFDYEKLMPELLKIYQGVIEAADKR